MSHEQTKLTHEWQSVVTANSDDYAFNYCSRGGQVEWFEQKSGEAAPTSDKFGGIFQPDEDRQITMANGSVLHLRKKVRTGDDVYAVVFR